eukprot:CAMPEP_0113475670 /NCGR_PEP_ID=MMETSP0014_2-20120614/19244_1 /TAXON_ID=2857 /ORGANISM="Nitzschia sp." /LENGTH=461 /DNA_ID=CAMNT_0000368605 /DNA_START=254 /DNA_END=1640 /DNA_ORIENTATION=- /assembly_acc=CAM_ASM_000159
MVRLSSNTKMTATGLIGAAVALVSVLASTTTAFTTAPRHDGGSTRMMKSATLHTGQLNPVRSFWTSPASSAPSTSPASSAPSNLVLSSSSSSAAVSQQASSAPSSSEKISKLAAMLTKVGMIAFIVSMCLTLPFALFPPWLLFKLGLIDQVKQQQLALRAGQFCARWLLRLIPFANVKCEPSHQPKDAEPAIWVCNHTSALDVFMMLAKDKELRGKYRRPIKIVYWQGLEDNFITKLLFRQCGFIPVQMAANAAGEANDYDIKSFKNLLKLTKQAFNEGFDVGILPEGQLNPHPTEKLLPIFPGAFTLAKMSRRPIEMMALHGTHKLWHAREDIGMTVTGRDVKLKIYPKSRRYTSGDEFVATFEAVVGRYATTGQDLDDDELNAWLDGTKWTELEQHRLATQEKENLAFQVLQEEQDKQQKAKKEEAGDKKMNTEEKLMDDATTATASGVGSSDETSSPP